MGLAFLGDAALSGVATVAGSLRELDLSGCIELTDAGEWPLQLPGCNPAATAAQLGGVLSWHLPLLWNCTPVELGSPPLLPAQGCSHPEWRDQGGG
jgi:hypothetical protein